MKFLLETLGAGVLLPTAASLAVGWILGRAAKGDLSRRYALAVACAAGFFAAYAVLESKALEPKSYWNWLPWVALVVALLNPVSLAPGVWLAERWLHLALLAAAAAWFLTPAWAALHPPRNVYLLRLGVAIFALSALLEPLDRRSGSATLLGVLSLAGFGAAVLVGAFVSLRFGLLGAALGGAMAASAFLAWKGGVDLSAAAVVPLYAALLCGLMVAVQTSDMLPEECYLLVPASPLAAWPFAVGPLSRLRTGWLVAARGIAVATPIGIALGRAAWVMRSSGGY